MLALRRNLAWILVVATVAVALPLPTRADGPLIVSQNSLPTAPADGWQRGFEIGGLLVDFFNLGCGLELFGRQKRKDFGTEFDNNKDWHIGFAATAGSINLLAAWQQWEINRQRKSFEFRHIAHNTLFWTNIAALVVSGILGVASTQSRSNSHIDAAHGLGVAMEATGFLSFGTTVVDVALFGGHDNATILGPKLAF